MSKTPHTSPEKHSELWQRLRAARRYGKVTQDQVAKATGVSRPAISLWEAITPDNRTMPTAEQVMTVAQLCGVSPQYLMDDSARPDDVYTYGSSENIRSPLPQAGEVEQTAAKARAFWAAVKFHVVMERPDLEKAFDVPVRIAGEIWTVPFLHADNLALLGGPGGNSRLVDDLGMLLVMERAAGHPYKKHLLRWSPGASAPMRLDPSFDIHVASFSDIAAAAQALLKL